MSGKHDKVKDSERFSIITNKLDRCYICGSSNGVQLHEVFFGTANRAKSKEEGLVIPLCMHHHDEIHKNIALDTKMKEKAEKVWILSKGYSEEDGIKKFIEKFHKNYI